MAKNITVKPMELPRFMPSLSLDEDDLPQLKNLKVGDKCTLKITAELTRQSKGSDYADNDEPKTLSGTFKVLGVEYEPSDAGSRTDKLDALKKKSANYK